MAIEEESHSELKKSFLSFTIPAGTDGPTSTDMALDLIFRDPEDVVVEEFQEAGFSLNEVYTTGLSYLDFTRGCTVPVRRVLLQQNILGIKDQFLAVPPL